MSAQVYVKPSHNNGIQDKSFPQSKKANIIMNSKNYFSTPDDNQLLFGLMPYNAQEDSMPNPNRRVHTPKNIEK